MRGGAEEGCIFVAKMLKSNPDAIKPSAEEVSTPVEEPAPIVKQPAVQKPKPVPTQTSTPKKPAKKVEDDGPSLLDFGASNSQTSLEVLVSTTKAPVQQQQQQTAPVVPTSTQPASKDAIMNMFNTPTQPAFPPQPMYGQYPPPQQQQVGRGYPPAMGHQPYPPQQFNPAFRGTPQFGYPQQPPMGYPPQQHHGMYAPPQGRGFVPMGHQPPMYAHQQQQPYPANPAFRGTPQYGYK